MQLQAKSGDYSGKSDYGRRGIATVQRFPSPFRPPDLINWHRAGEDVERELPVPSTFLSHANVRDTYWYLSAGSELMNHAVGRLDKRWEVRS